MPRAYLIAWLLWSLSLPAVALDPDVPLKQLRHTVWLAKDGLPSDAMTAFEQTTDGYIWIATYGGVYQFDGKNFERVILPRDPKLRSASAYSLFATRDGGLWIGFVFGGIGFLKDGKLRMYDGKDGLPPGSVRAIIEDLSGAMWVATSAGVARQGPSGRWERVNFPPSALTVFQLYADDEGSIWAHAAGGVFRREPGRTSFEFVEPVERADSRKTVLSGPDGSVWVVDSTSVRRLTRPSKRLDRYSGHGRQAVFDSQGAVWLAHGHALLRTRPGSTEDKIEFASLHDRFEVSDGFGSSFSPISQLLTTQDGQTWYLTTTSLERFSTRVVTQLDTSFLTPENAEQMAIGVQEDGTKLLMPASGPLQSLVHGRGIPVEGLNDVTAIARTADGTTWAGGDSKPAHGGDARLAHHAADGWRTVMPPPGIEHLNFQAIAGRSIDDLWVSVARKGVFHFQGGAWQKNGGLAELPSEPAVTLAWDANENLWLGYADGLIARVHGSKVQLLTAAEGADLGVVTALIAQGSTVWAGGEYGLRRWNGQTLTRLRPDRDRAFDLVTGIVETAAGDVWLSSAAGIVRIRAADVARADQTQGPPVVVDVFDRLDGYAGSSARVRPLPTAVEGKDGTLWFASTAGIFSVDPKTLVKPRSPPLPRIRALMANGDRYEPTAPIVLRKGTSGLQIDFVGLDLEVPERVRYRIKLDRVDADWREVGTWRQAFYTNLGAGDYRFHVVASSDGRVWSPQEASLGFRIEPTFTQTAWFFALCVVAALGAVALLLRWRVRLVSRRLRWKLDTQLAERDRIARELHDTLLQSTQGLILRFQAISNRMPPGDANREQMDTALERADEVLTEGRDRVRGLRRAAAQRSSLACVLPAIGDEFAADAQIAFRFDSSGEEPPLSLEVADEIQRIVSEALLNACRHGKAQTVDLRLTNGPRELVVIVDDDGVGIDAETASSGSRPGHWGLRGMRERSERIGARLTIAPREGGGTRVELTLPIGPAGRRT